jgi:hypothetical protein
LPVNLEDTGWLASGVRAHEAVMEVVAADQTLIPMRFCTIFMSEDRITDTVEGHYDAIVAALARLRGKREWGAKAYADADVLAQRARVTSERSGDLTPARRKRREEPHSSNGNCSGRPSMPRQRDCGTSARRTRTTISQIAPISPS